MLREELSWKYLPLRFHRIDVFCTAQWRWPRMVFVVYRLLMASYAIFALTHILVVTQATARILAFLTIWTYIIQTSFFLTGAVLAIFFVCFPHRFAPLSVDENSHRPCRKNTAFDDKVIVSSPFNENIVNSWEPGSGDTSGSVSADGFSSSSYVNGRGDIEEGKQASTSTRECQADNRPMSLPWYVQLHWALGNVIQVSAPVVTVIYFSALYPSARHAIGAVNFDDINVHGINTVMILIDVSVSCRPVRLLHVFYPILYGTAYVIFSVIFWSQDPQHNVLYPNVLDWNQPGISTAVVLGLALVGFPLLQLAHFGLYQLKLKLYHCMYNEPCM